MSQHKLRPVQPALYFFLYILGAYAVAALLCVPFGEYVTEAAGVPTHKFISRGGLLLGLLGAWPFVRAMNLANRQALGYVLPRRQFRLAMLGGLAAGVLILACLSFAHLALGIRLPAVGDGSPLLIKVIGQGLLSGLAVGFIEETFFRGALFSAVRDRGGSAAAATILTALVYAAVHFVKPQPFPADAEVTLTSCFASLGGAFPALFRAENLDSFVALFMVGVFLGIVRHRSGHIAWCIGLHAGWVLVIKATHKYSYIDVSSPFNPLVSTYDGVIGWLAAGWIGALAATMAFWPDNKSRR